MNRLIQPSLKEDLKRKTILLFGPRQVGKTTLSKNLYKKYDYFNYDSSQDRQRLRDQSWDRKTDLLIFDEIHKMKNWKSWLKGIIDTKSEDLKLIVTGSARLDISKKMGDSLAGRFFQYRIYPLDIKEAHHSLKLPTREIFERLMKVGGFPEPFLDGTEKFYGRWAPSHLDIILRQDLLDLEAPRNIRSFEILIDLLSSRVGSTVSYASLAHDLERDPKTIKNWLQILENLYIIFSITPHSKRLSRSIKKEPKYYFYDIARVKGDEGSRLENLVALSLKKELHYLADVEGIESSLNFIRTKDKREIDFYIEFPKKNKSWLIEVKTSDASPAPAFRQLASSFKTSEKLQLVQKLERESTHPDGLEIRRLIDWLKEMPLL